MNKILKKVMATVLMCALVLSLVACGQKEDKTASTDTKATEATVKTDEPATEAPAEDITLNVWHLWTTESDANAVSFAKALEMYKADHPNVTVEIDATENEAYKTKIKTAISANEAPDVFFSWGAGFSQPFVDAGQVLDLQANLAPDALKNLNMSTTNNFTYGDKLYGVPFISWLGVLYCNQEMFDAAGVKVPETYDELLTAVAAFKAEGKVPLALGAKDAWTAMFFQNVATVRTAGVDVSTQALQKKVSYDTPEFVAGAQMVTDLVNAEAFDPATLALTYDEAKMEFLSGNSPMIYMGSWLAAEIQNPELSTVVGKVVAKNFPGLTGGKFNNQFLGGAIDGLMANANTEHPKEAAEFIAYITEKMSRESFLGGAGVPTYAIDVTGETIDPLVQQIVDLSKTADGYIVAWDTFLSGADVTTHLSLVQEVFAGTKTPKEFAEGMQTLN